MDLANRIQEISKLLKELLPFVSQWDENVFKGNHFSHPWLDQIQKFSPDELYQFDGNKDKSILQDPSWINTINKIEQLTSFMISKSKISKFQVLGNIKKQHELNQLFNFLEDDKGKEATDFGGGVGNLAYFLESHLEMKVQVLEKDKALIETGKLKLKKLKSKVSFNQVHIGHDKVQIKNKELAIGLHTCGSFANAMLSICAENKIDKIINFGCCYSKLIEGDYNLSKLSDKEILLNTRALSAGTLGHKRIPQDFFVYRTKILNFKYSFYHWLYFKHKKIHFTAMSNSKRSLYHKSFFDFTNEVLTKYFPELTPPTEFELMEFYLSEDNQKLMHYLNSYYALSRYIGPLVESYLLCDRALLLQEQGYTTEIIEIFDHQVSPRNKAIIASKSRE